MQQVVLARLRQLAAHEVGHTLGLQHNFAASTTNRASVMDYPAPLVTLGADGLTDLSNAYAKGIGEWDKVSIAYGYQDFPAGTNEGAALDKILREAFDRGLRYLTDQDARPASASSSYTHLWDNGANVIDGLANLMKVRNAALAHFGENNIREGAPMATLEDVRIRTSPTFDALAPAEVFANHVCDFLFNPERAARIVEFHARDSANYPAFGEVIDKILAETLRAPVRSGYEDEIQRTVNAVVLNELMGLAANERASNEVRAIAEYHLDALKNWLRQQVDLTRDEN